MKSADWTFATLRKRYCTTRIALGRDNRTSARLLQFGKKIVDKRPMYGASEGEVEPVKHLIGSVLLWCDNREGCTLQLEK